MYPFGVPRLRRSNPNQVPLIFLTQLVPRWLGLTLEFIKMKDLFPRSLACEPGLCLTLKNPDPHFHRNTWRMSDLQCYTETWRNAHCPYFLCFSDTWRMAYLPSVQNQCILQQSLRRLKLLKNLENVIFARNCHIWHSPGITRSQLNKCHKSYNNNNTVLAWLKLSYMPRSGDLGVKSADFHSESLHSVWSFPLESEFL